MRVIRYPKRASICVLAGFLAGSCILSAGSRHEPAVTLLIDTQNTGAKIPEDFSGLSFEMETLLPEKNGSQYFSESNRALIQTFRNLGVKNLRVGAIPSTGRPCHSRISRGSTAFFHLPSPRTRM